METEITTIDLGSLINELGPTAAAEEIDRVYGKKIKNAYSEGKADGLRNADSRESRWRIFWCSLVVIVSLGLVGSITWWTLVSGSAKDRTEMQACQSGQVAGCLSGVERYEDHPRAAVYQKTYEAATGKPLPSLNGERQSGPFTISENGNSISISSEEYTWNINKAAKK